jgi:hypothetical protein
MHRRSITFNCDVNMILGENVSAYVLCANTSAHLILFIRLPSSILCLGCFVAHRSVASLVVAVFTNEYQTTLMYQAFFHHTQTLNCLYVDAQM